MSAFAPHLRGTMAEPRIAANVTRNGAYGSARVNSTSCLPFGSTLVIRLYQLLYGAAVSGAIIRSYQNLTSSASNSLPSWNLTPWRSLNVQVVGLGFVHDSARAGVTVIFSSNMTRLW